MSESLKSLHIRSKVWIEDSAGKVVFGLGRLRMLEAIHRSGSIHSAAKELKMSYRALWGRIKATEKRLGKALLVRVVGGASGGGSRLTPFAAELMENFQKLNQTVESQCDRMFDHDFKR